MRTDFVEHVDARHVYSVSFNGIDELVCGGVASERNVRTRHSVLFANRLDGVVVQMCHPNRSADIDTALFLLLERNRCWLLV
jgi:nickel-dependent lactate racemase